MATIKANKGKNGEIISYRIRGYIGLDERGNQIRVTCTIPRPEGLTPKKEEKEVKRLADDWEKQKREEHEKNKSKESEEVNKERDKITVVDFIEKVWMVKHVDNGNHTPTTKAFYKARGNNILAYFKERDPKRKLKDVDIEMVTDFLAYFRKDARKPSGEAYSKTTIYHNYSTLRNILEFAKYMKYIKEDPVAEIRRNDIPQRTEYGEKVNFLDEEEAIRFITCLDSPEEREYWEKKGESSLYWKVLVHTLIYTGLRRGELVGLQWKDVDSKNRLLHVRQNVTPDSSNKAETDPEKKYHVGETKGKTDRDCPITKHLLDLLTDLKAEQDKRFGGTLLPATFVFCRPDNPYLPLYPTEPTRMMAKFVKRHNLPNMSPHDLRHTAGYLAKAGGADMRDIQALLGHKDPAMTQKIYVGMTEKCKRMTVDGIESILCPDKAESELPESTEEGESKAAK